jgi:hypothetical protein
MRLMIVSILALLALVGCKQSQTSHAAVTPAEATKIAPHATSALP